MRGIVVQQPNPYEFVLSLEMSRQTPAIQYQWHHMPASGHRATRYCLSVWNKTHDKWTDLQPRGRCSRRMCHLLLNQHGNVKVSHFMKTFFVVVS